MIHKRIAVEDVGALPDWDRALTRLGAASPLQSWQWGEAKQELGERVVRLVATHGGRPVAACQVFRRRVPRVGLPVAWIPGGPVLGQGENGHPAAGAALRKALGRLGFRLIVAQPYLEPAQVLLGWPLWLSAPSQTLCLDLSRNVEEMDRALYKPWRTNKDRFFRQGGQVLEAVGADAPEPLAALYEGLVERKGFTPNGGPEMIRAVWKAFAGQESSYAWAHVFRAVKDGKCVASLFLLRTSGAALGVWSASDYEARNIKPNEALQWSAALRLKELGCPQYDLGGGAAKGSGTDSSVSGFKRHMGADLVDLPRMRWALP